MWIKTLHLSNINGFLNSGNLNLSKGINLLVGKNNSGKSTIIKSIYKLQNPVSITNKDLRINSKHGAISISFEEFNSSFFINEEKEFEPHIKIFLNKESDAIPDLNIELMEGDEKRSRKLYNEEPKAGFINPEEPHNFIYPFLSKRKVSFYDENVNIKNASSIGENLEKLISKIDRVVTVGYPGHEEFKELSLDLFGFHISTYQSINGKKAGLIIDKQMQISIDSMGEGIANLLGLTVNLLDNENKLFLIEEPENDVHPEALKKILNFIIKSSETNQFVITTHSNIVTKYLGSIEGSKIFNLNMILDKKIPLSTIIEIENTQESRRKVLEELGYDLYDFDLWKGYLILEESSAESIIKYLIKWFVPKLENKLRTISTHGIDKVEAKLEDFGRLVTFLNLEPIYINKSWVILDRNAKHIIEKIQAKFKKWNTDQFSLFSKDNFEEFYPEQFKARFEQILKDTPKKQKKDEKEKLTKDILEWVGNNEEVAKKLFEVSAKEVIDILKGIKNKLLN